ncbi:LemA family protein [Alistipes sp.]|uniref:LemA family protein n=1 Tax=Alistipes sp. TaxID=1872444 RepID=UPI003AF01492
MTLVLILVGIALFAFIGAYNSLIVKRNDVTNAFASIDAILKKRYDLIPNLVATVRAYAKHEHDTFAEVTALRTKDYAQLTDAEKRALEAGMQRAQTAFNLTAEQYPQLRASDNFLQLQGALNETEEQLSAARRAYNAAVTHYNNTIQIFPTNVFASLFGFKAMSVLETAEAERKNPDVKKLFE